MGETPQRLAKEASFLSLCGVVPGQNEEGRRVVRADSRQGDELRGRFLNQPLELGVQL